MNNQHGNKEQAPKEIGSNLTGTAVHAKPGHQRDIPIDRYIEDLDDKGITASERHENSLEKYKTKDENKENQNKGSEN
ncbi:hypothetical protein [Pedobacter sp. V48]|uniref:hypothetical protein n=1 Tax=Pedobacter sp. V48 TaxID=509635 RepID=UPI0003E4B06C|nr:hypothetical protein [Pedobacter sp. V48]ETZ22544.1 hypothetical protein N824_23380 [Pedobacter sp. V48]